MASISFFNLIYPLNNIIYRYMNQETISHLNKLIKNVIKNFLVDGGRPIEGNYDLKTPEETLWVNLDFVVDGSVRSHLSETFRDIMDSYESIHQEHIYRSTRKFLTIKFSKGGELVGSLDALGYTHGKISEFLNSLYRKSKEDILGRYVLHHPEVYLDYGNKIIVMLHTGTSMLVGLGEIGN